MIRQLRPDEPLPPGIPRRYKSQHGYMRLRWTIAPGQQVEIYEHRLVAGRDAVHVHHINGDRDDNRPENLECVSPRDHHARHERWSVAEAADLYYQGWSLKQLGAHFHVHHTNILRRLKRYGLAMRSMSAATTVWHAQRKCHSRIMKREAERVTR